MTRPLTQSAPTDLAYLQAQVALPVLSTILVKAAVTWTLWRRTHRTRGQLKHLDDHLLKDVGLTRNNARKEADKPFWML